MGTKGTKQIRPGAKQNVPGYEGDEEQGSRLSTNKRTPNSPEPGSKENEDIPPPGPNWVVNMNVKTSCGLKKEKKGGMGQFCRGQSYKGSDSGSGSTS